MEAPLPTKVNGQMIVVAREFRGMTATELKNRLGISGTLLSMMERNIRHTNPELVDKLSTALDLPTWFFTRPAEVYPCNSHWRRKSTSSAKHVKQAEAEMNIHRLALEAMLSSLSLADKELPSMDVEEYGSPKTVAKTLRQLWHIPRGPIHDLFAFIEANGVYIIQCDFLPGIEGRTMYTRHKEPIIFVSRSASIDRQRLTVAHELGHLLMHEPFSIPPSRDIEAEAMEFASEFLMPEDQLLPQLRRPVRIEALATLKRHWKVSMQAILMRAKHEGLVHQHEYIRLWQQFNTRGWKKREPSELDPPMEHPTMLMRMIEKHISDLDHDIEDVAALVGLKREDVENWYLRDRTRIRPMSVLRRV